MKLNEEDRNIIVGLQMEKAHLFLQQADENFPKKLRKNQP